MSVPANQRGWGMPHDGYASSHIVRLRVQGVTLYVHRDVAPLVAMFLNELCRRSGYRLREGWCWSYAYRPIRGHSVWEANNNPIYWSNHSWGLAVDINAPVNPMSSVLHTNLPIGLVHELCQKYNFRWGGDYSGRKDAMHIEFMGTPTEARSLAAYYTGHATRGTTRKPLSKHNNPFSPPASNAVFHVKATGSKVQWVQWALGISTDGTFGPNTQAAVKTFQKHAHLTADGVVGPRTIAAMRKVTR